MKRYFDIATKEVYTSKGEQKTKWHNVGKLMELDDGGFILNIPLLPKLYVFPQKEHNKAVQQAENVSKGIPPQTGVYPEDPEDSIPF